MYYFFSFKILETVAKLAFVNEDAEKTFMGMPQG